MLSQTRLVEHPGHGGGQGHRVAHGDHQPGLAADLGQGAGIGHDHRPAPGHGLQHGEAQELGNQYATAIAGSIDRRKHEDRRPTVKDWQLAIRNRAGESYVLSGGEPPQQLRVVPLRRSWIMAGGADDCQRGSIRECP